MAEIYALKKKTLSVLKNILKDTNRVIIAVYPWVIPRHYWSFSCPLHNFEVVSLHEIISIQYRTMKKKCGRQFSGVALVTQSPPKKCCWTIQNRLQ